MRFLMDGARFDLLTRRVSRRDSRRTLLRTFLGSGLVTAFGGSTRQAAAATCLENGAKCHKSAPQACCSGSCRNKRGVFRCRRAPAFSCTAKQRTCAGGATIFCPGNPNGVCDVTVEGKPV